jgi:hypothetical protein
MSDDLIKRLDAGIARCDMLADAVPAALTEAQDTIARLEAALGGLRQWCDAYPVAVFPEPDLKRVAQVLKEAGLTLDAVSASNFRHVLTRVREITDAALSPGEGEGGTPNYSGPVTFSNEPVAVEVGKLPVSPKTPDIP